MTILSFDINGNAYSFYRCKYAPVESNMYILILDNEAIVIDAMPSKEMKEFLDANGVKTIYLFLTHEHYDHSNGVCWWKENFNTILLCHKYCSEKLSTYDRSNPRLVAFKLFELDKIDGGNRYDEFKRNFVPYNVRADIAFESPTTFTIQNHIIQTIHTPGHTPGSSLYMLDNSIIFTGDTMIKDHKIINGFKGGSIKDMYDITLPILQQLPDKIIVMPGHGEPFIKKEFDFSIYNV